MTGHAWLQRVAGGLSPELVELLTELAVSIFAPLVAYACWRAHKGMFAVFHVLLAATYSLVYLPNWPKFMWYYIPECCLCTLPILELHISLGAYLMCFVLYFYKMLHPSILLKVLPNMLVTLSMAFLGFEIRKSTGSKKKVA